jgi:glycosyltransferase involved in cell wall biosynthesis
MRILRSIASLDPATGGPVEGLLRSSRALADMDVATDIVTLDASDAPWLADIPFPVHALGPGTRRYSYSPRLTPWMKAHAKAYDAVILHGIWNYSSVGAWRGLAGAGTPYLLFTHGMLDPYFRSAHPLKHWAKQAYWLALEGRVLRDARAVLFTTEEERLLARGAFTGHSYTERVVAYGTSDVAGDAGQQIRAFKARVPDLRRPFLLFLSRLHPKKGCDLLIRAFSQSGSDLDLVMAGPDQTGWAGDLKALARDLGIADRVHFPGMLAGDGKWGAYRAAEAFVLPSHQENFGIVVAEAMACGKPVLITNRVNIWREVEADGGGLVGADDLDGIAGLLRRFAELGDEERRAMGAAARAGFLKHFEIGVAARSIKSLIEGACP